MLITRVEQFSAAHRLHSRTLSDEENKALYGACNWINGHGHNYRVEVTVSGPMDQQTGMVVNIAELAHIIRKHALSKLDHKFLDKDIDFFENRPSTTENVAIFIWNCLVDKVTLPAQLDQIKLYETEKNYVIYRGE